MILVDSSVWIDYFRGATTAECDLLDRLLGSERLLTGDLILVEVLQGFRSEVAFRRALDLLGTLEFLPLAGREIAIAAARNYRTLRSKGMTVRKTIDGLIVPSASPTTTRCCILTATTTASSAISVCG